MSESKTNTDRMFTGTNQEREAKVKALAHRFVDVLEQSQEKYTGGDVSIAALSMVAMSGMGYLTPLEHTLVMSSTFRRANAQAASGFLEAGGVGIVGFALGMLDALRVQAAEVDANETEKAAENPAETAEPESKPDPNDAIDSLLVQIVAAMARRK